MIRETGMLEAEFSAILTWMGSESMACKSLRFNFYFLQKDTEAALT